MQNTFCHFAQHLLAGPAAKFLHFPVDGIKTATFTELHGDGYGAGGLVHECSVVLADVRRSAILVEFELAEDLSLHVRVWRSSDNL